jgi:hypothetical protein
MSLHPQPELSILILDFLKPYETITAIKSVKQFVQVPHTLIYYHNGPAAYPAYLLHHRQLGISQLGQSSLNEGLGVGTRQLIASCTTKYFIYLQNDQEFVRPFTQADFEVAKKYLAGDTYKSISLAGPVCGEGIYSERAHIMETKFYKSLEPLPDGGAGPYHSLPWREGAIQEIYKEVGYIHKPFLYNNNVQFVGDGGYFAVRENPDRTVWVHRPDTKQLWLASGTPVQKHVYPKFTDEEWVKVLRGDGWTDGLIPIDEIKDSFVAWNLPDGFVTGYINNVRSLLSPQEAQQVLDNLI